VDVPETGQARWFAENVLPHEPMLRAWLRSRFSTETDVDDLIQEAYVRVLAARERCEMRAPKAFLFATARNLAMDRLRHRQVTGANCLAETDVLTVLDDAGSIPETVSRSEEIEILTQAIQSLPKRCRQVLTLRKLYGLSQRRIAAQLGIAEHTVEAQGAIGLRKCAEFFARHARRGPQPHG
jgi:RNA polymerase sigma-70 factor (ECF subfamily)